MKRPKKSQTKTKVFFRVETFSRAVVSWEQGDVYGYVCPATVYKWEHVIRAYNDAQREIEEEYRKALKVEDDEAALAPKVVR